MIFVVVLLIILSVGYISAKLLRRPAVGNLHLITGGVKKGKTAHSVNLALKLYKKAVRHWKRHGKVGDKPVLYSNVPLIGVPFTPITFDLLEMKVQPPAGSMLYINEASLLSGSKDIRDEELNDIFLRFYKLIAHITRGGYCIIDTQSVMDCHYTIKRSLSSYWNILATVKIPYIGLISVIENREVVDPEIRTQIELSHDDNTEKLIQMIVPRARFIKFVPATIYKRYDRYAYYDLVSDKPVYIANVTSKSGSAHEILRYRKGAKR